MYSNRRFRAFITKKQPDNRLNASLEHMLFSRRRRLHVYSLAIPEKVPFVQL
jgi:hypothetical protein